MSALTRYLPKLSIAAGLLLLALAACGVLWAFTYARAARAMTDPAKARREGKPIPVRTAAAQEAQVLEQPIGGTLVTAASQLEHIQLGASAALFLESGPASELIFKVANVREGDFVRKGDIMFELDPEVFERVLRQKLAALNAAKANLEFTKEALTHNEEIRDLDVSSHNELIKFRVASRENRQKAEEVYERLYRDKAATQLEYLENRSKLAEAIYNLHEAESQKKRIEKAKKSGDLRDKTELARAISDFESASAIYEQTKRDIERLRIKAPLDGFVSYGRKPEVSPGTRLIRVNQVICNVVRLDPIKVRMDLPQERLDDVFDGQEAQAFLDPWPQEPFPGKVTAITPQVSPQTRTQHVWISIPNPNNRIKPGISGYVRLKGKPRKAITVPSTAVLEKGSKAMVFRVEDGRARMREVQKGHLIGPNDVEILSGLEPKDEVVIFHAFYRNAGNLEDGKSYLQDNDRVNPDWETWARRK